MTIHPEIARQIAREMVANGGDYQSAYGAVWRRTIPPQQREIPQQQIDAGMRGAETMRRRGAERRAELVQPVLDLHREGLINNEIARRLHCSKWTVTVILQGAGLRPNLSKSSTPRHDWEAIIPRVMRLREGGTSWNASAAAVGVSSAALRHACRERDLA